MINTFAVLLVFQTLGEALVHALGLPIPGPVLGMLLLFVYLLLNGDAAAKLAPTSLELLKHLSLLFVPAGVGIMVHGQRIAAEWLPIVAALVASTVVSIVVTAAVVRLLQKPVRDEAAAEAGAGASIGTRIGTGDAAAPGDAGTQGRESP